MNMSEEFRQRRVKYFLMRTIKDENGCLIWQGAITTKTGYGHAGILGKTVDIHVFMAFSVLLHNDEEREEHSGLLVLHSCDDRACVNPEHLFFGTHLDNMQDAKAKGRVAAGERNGFSKLTEEEVVEIRRLYRTGPYISQSKLGKMFGVTQSEISHIVNNKVWH